MIHMIEHTHDGQLAAEDLADHLLAYHDALPFSWGSSKGMHARHNELHECADEGETGELVSIGRHAVEDEADTRPIFGTSLPAWLDARHMTRRQLVENRIRNFTGNGDVPPGSRAEQEFRRLHVPRHPRQVRQESSDGI